MADPTTNRGAVALKVKLSDRGARAALAKAFGIDQALVSHWLSGERRPDSHNRAKIEDAYQVFWRSWDIDLSAEEALKVEAEIREEAAADADGTFLDPASTTRTGTVG